MSDAIRWGILSTGSIAKKFAQGLPHTNGGKLVAVGSRTQAAADAFGDDFDVPRRHGSYEALADDPEVDAIYVATPHNLHKDHSILCLNAGKAVLCEKPFTINAGQAEEMVRVAREKGLFLMEAMWTRYLPIMVRLRELLKDSVIGDVRMLYADFGFRAGFNPESRLLNPEYGGGGLLDVGVYTVSLAYMIFGEPDRIASLAHIGDTGVDEQAAAVLGFNDGRIAITASAVRTNTPQAAVLMGTEGQIRLHAPWWQGTTMTLSVNGKNDERIELPYDGNGYNFEADEVMECLRQGKVESPHLPLDESIAIMKTLDAIRQQWGLKYPME